MLIAAEKIVTLNYVLKDEDGTLIDQVDDGSFFYLHGANNIVPGLENALTGRKVGDRFSISIPPEEGYGHIDEDKVHDVPRDMFPDDSEIEIGMQFYAEGPNEETVLLTIAAIDGDTITVDGNPPLAGVQLNFDVTVAGIRDATAEEIEHGHPHDEGCCH